MEERYSTRWSVFAWRLSACSYFHVCHVVPLLCVDAHAHASVPLADPMSSNPALPALIFRAVNVCNVQCCWHRRRNPPVWRTVLVLRVRGKQCSASHPCQCCWAWPMRFEACLYPWRERSCQAYCPGSSLPWRDSWMDPWQMRTSASTSYCCSRIRCWTHRVRSSPALSPVYSAPCTLGPLYTRCPAHSVPCTLGPRSHDCHNQHVPSCAPSHRDNMNVGRMLDFAGLPQAGRSWRITWRGCSGPWRQQ